MLEQSQQKPKQQHSFSALMEIALSNNTIQIWSMEKQKLLYSLPPPERAVVTVWFTSKIGDLSPSFHVGLNDGSVLCWRVAGWQLLRTIDGSHSNVQIIKFSPSGQHFAVLYNDSTIGFGHFTVRRQIWMKPVKGNETGDIWFVPSGNQLAVAMRDNTLEVWDATNGKPTAWLRGHSDRVTAFAFDSVSNKEVSGALDRTVHVWNIDNRKELAVFDNFGSPIVALTYQPREKQFVSRTSEGDLRFQEDMPDKAVGSQRSNISDSTIKINEATNQKINKPVKSEPPHPHSPYTIPVGESLQIQIHTEPSDNEHITVLHDRFPRHADFIQTKVCFHGYPT